MYAEKMYDHGSGVGCWGGHVVSARESMVLSPNKTYSCDLSQFSLNLEAEVIEIKIVLRT